MMISKPFSICSIHTRSINLLEIFIELFSYIQNLFQQVKSQRFLLRPRKCLCRPRCILNLPTPISLHPPTTNQLNNKGEGCYRPFNFFEASLLTSSFVITDTDSSYPLIFPDSTILTPANPKKFSQTCRLATLSKSRYLIAILILDLNASSNVVTRFVVKNMTR